MISMACHVINIHAPATNWLLKHVHFNILNILYFSFYFEKKTNRKGYSEKIKLNVISRLTSVTPSCGLVTMAWGAVWLKKDNDYDDIYIL